MGGSCQKKKKKIKLNRKKLQLPKLDKPLKPLAKHDAKTDIIELNFSSKNKPQKRVSLYYINLQNKAKIM